MYKVVCGLKTLNQQELKSIEQFFQLNQPQLMKAMKHYLNMKYEKVIATKEYLIAVGDIPVALVAHLDTVFKNPPHDIFYDRVKNVMWSPDGLGADDRAGVYAIVQILKSGLRPTVIFTTDEELGCVGADALAEQVKTPPVDLKYVIELDRRGSNDCVFYSCNNPEFDAYVESFGFVTNFGSFSDISVICPEWKIAGVNLSIGYYDEHSVSETLYVGQMFDTIKKVKNMLQDAVNAPKFAYIEDYSSKWFKRLKPFKEEEDWGWDPSYGISKEEWASFMEPQTKCHKCGQWDYDYNLFPTKDEDNKTVFFCCDCLPQVEGLFWCNVCGEPYIDKEDSGEKLKEKLCKDCRGKVNGDFKSEKN